MAIVTHALKDGTKRYSAVVVVKGKQVWRRFRTMREALACQSAVREVVMAERQRQAEARLTSLFSRPGATTLEARLGPAHGVMPAAARSGPLVYACFTAAGRVRYIGVSRRGLRRPLDSGHKAFADVAPDDEIRVWTYPTVEAAVEAEQALITAFMPPQNKKVASVSRTTLRDAPPRVVPDARRARVVLVRRPRSARERLEARSSLSVRSSRPAPSIASVAASFAVPPATVTRLLQTGQLASLDPEDIARFMDASRVPARPRNP